MNPKNNDSFKKLQDHWYKKLAKEGFSDLEQSDGNLKSWTTGKKHNPTAQSNADYYRLAGFFLHDHAFDCETDKKIWSLHAEGLGHREISEILTKSGVRKRKRQVILNIITKLKAEMFKLYGNN